MFIIFGRLPLKMDFMYFVYFMCVEIMCVHTATWENSQWLNVLPCINILEKKCSCVTAIRKSSKHAQIIEMRKRGSGRGKSMLIKEKYMIEYVAEYKYLGVVITEKGYNKTFVTNIKDRSLKAIFKLCRALSHCYVRPKFRLSLFDKVIKPIACYGGEILGQYMWRQRFLDKDTAWKRLDENDIEKVHLNIEKMWL